MSKVADWFITPLEAHFEDQPTEGGRETLLEDLDAYSTEELTAAVEWLKRSRQSVKTFPSPKECLKAIKAVAGVGSKLAVVARRQDITSESYAEMALLFNAGRDKVPIIRKDTQWEEWHQYWRWLRAWWLLDLVDNRESWTVPSEFPSAFDPRFQPVHKPKATPSVGDPDGEEHAA